MNVWAISDLHLSMARLDPRERFADRWRDHAAKLNAEWRSIVRREDLVLLPGDISMANNHRDLQPDLKWLAALPGRKVLAPGNHDRWWNDLKKVRTMLRPSLHAVEGDARRFGDIIVAGARSAPVPHRDDVEDEAARREEQRTLAGLDAALQTAVALRETPDQPIALLWHFPPFDPYGRPGPWVERFEAAGVTHCLYGHLHSQAQWGGAVQGRRGNVKYHCVAADALGFRPLLIQIG